MLPVFTFIPFQNADTVIQQTSTRIYHQFQGQTTLVFSQQSSSILSKRSSPYEFTDTLNKYPKPDPVPAMTRTFQNSVNNRPPFFPLKKSIADKINFFSNMGCMEDQLEVPFLINNPQNLNQFNFINAPRREYEDRPQDAVIRQNFAPPLPLIGIPIPGNATGNPFFPPDNPNPNLLGNYSRQRTIQVIYQEIENEEASDVIPQAQTDNSSPNSNDTPFSENRFENQSMSPQEASSRGTMQNSITEKGYKDVFQTNISPKEAPLNEKDENSEQTPQIRTLSIQQFDDLREDLKDENNGNFIIPPLAMSSKDEISGLQTCKIISAKNSCQKARNQLKLKRRTPGKKEKAQGKGVKEVVSVRCGLEYQAKVRPLSLKQDNTSRRKLKNKWNPEIMSNDCLLKLTQDLEAYLEVSVDHEKLGKLILNQENNVKKVVELVKANKKKYVKLFSLAQEGNKVKSS